MLGNCLVAAVVTQPHHLHARPDQHSAYRERGIYCCQEDLLREHRIQQEGLGAGAIYWQKEVVSD